jgi:hypothetical protein
LTSAPLAAAALTTTRAITPAFAHRFPSSLTFFVAELPVTVRVELFNHLSAHLTIAAGSLLLFLRRRLHCREQRQRQHQCYQCVFHGPISCITPAESQKSQILTMSGCVVPQ